MPRTLVKSPLRLALTLCCLVIGGLFGADARAAGEPSLYAGGVAGVADLASPDNSNAFRAAGGGLYLHNTGWGKLTPEQRSHVLSVFHGAPVAVELGFGSGAAWGQLYESRYLIYGISPVFIAANAFANNNHPTSEQWRNYSDALRAHGVPASTLILPTFEYQNFKENIATLSDNKVSLSPVFQDIIKTAGGIVLDTPSGYSMDREQSYRDWVVDAIRWASQHRLTSVVIISPHSSGAHWGEDTGRYVRYLRSNGAMPSAFVCENYRDPAPPDYVNVVGNDKDPATALGNCQLLRNLLAHGPD